MTYEEGKSIERLNRFKTIEVLYSNTFAMHIEQLKTVQEDIETVLNMLKEKDKEIEKKDRIIDLMAEHIAFCKNINSYEDIKTYKRQIKQYFERKSKE